MIARRVRLLFVCLGALLALSSQLSAQSAGYLSGRMIMTPWNYPQPDFQPINLSDPEILDWTYWGLSSNTSVDRKSGAGIIGSLSVIGPDVPTQDQNCFDEFTWSNGDQNPSLPIACAGLMVFNTGEGYQFTVPADRTPKTLKLYVGIEGATARLEAHLSDASASAYVDTSLVTDGAAAATYAIDFQAGSPGQTLTVTYTIDDLEWGEVTIEAAVLTPKHPSVAITQPTPGQAFTAPAMFTASASASQVGATLDSVSLLQDGNSLLTLTNPPFNFDVSGLAAGNYQLTAQALDSNNLTQTSDPVPIHVVGTGGELAATIASPPDAVDLTQQGTADWILLGRDPNVDVDRKANVAPLIHTTTEPSAGGVSLIDWAYSYYYEDNLVSYTAEDGNNQFGPTTSGISLPNPGSGFEFSVDAGLTERTLRVYVGAYRAQGKFEAYMSDGSAPVFVDSSTDTQDQINHVYSITFHASSEGQKLIVRYTLLNNHNYGSITLQAITLDGAPVQGEVSATVASSPSTVDLTQVGTADWVLFGRYDNVAVDRKFAVKPVISQTTWINSNGPSAYHDNLVSYQAEDGGYPFTPTTSGVYIADSGGGFQFTVDAGTGERTVYVYVGAYRAQGKFEAFLSDGSAAEFVDMSTDTQGAINHVYSIRYHSGSDGQKLTIRYTLVNNYAAGNITLQAIAVDGAPVYVPTIRSISPTAAGIGVPITISGAHFGSTQGNGFVTVDGKNAPVTSWSDTSIGITVPQISDSGPVIVTTGGVSSNSVQFTFVLAARWSSQSVYISPDEVSMEVGQQRLLKLVDAQGTAVTDVTWSVDKSDLAQVVPSSDSSSSDQFLSALQPGKVTITAISSEGTAQAIATIYAAGAMPPGTPLWSVYPNNYNNYLSMPIKGMQNSPTDPYNYLIEQDGDETYFVIRALDQNGQEIWRKTFPGAPDFDGDPFAYPFRQIGTPDGGLLVFAYLGIGTGLIKVAPDGSQQWTRDASNYGQTAVGYDGTIYVVQNNLANQAWNVTALDGGTGIPRYSAGPSLTVSSSVVSNEQQTDDQADPYPCKDHVPDVSSGGIGGSYLAGPVVAANGHAYVVEWSSNSAFVYTSCAYSSYVRHDQPGDQGTTVYYLSYASGSITTSSEAALLELTPTGAGATIPIENYSYSGQAFFGDNSPLEKPDGTPAGMSWYVSGLAPDGAGGVLVNLSGGNTETMKRVYQNALQYSVPISGYDIAIGDSGLAFVNKGYLEGGVTAVNVADGSQAWTTNAGETLTATDDGGLIVQQYANDLSSSTLSQLDQTGALVNSPFTLLGRHVQYADSGQAFVDNPNFGSISKVSVPIASATALTYPYPLSLAGDASKTNAATPKAWFPSLDHCTTGGDCIGPYEAIYNALDDLIARLPALDALAQTNIFDKIGVDYNGYQITTQSFIHYLASNRPRFYNGLVSSYCYDSLTESRYCWPWTPMQFLINEQNVGDVFAAGPAQTITAITGSPSYPMLSFFNPNLILFANLGENLGNEAVIFHEALHGMTGLYDFQTPARLKPQLLERLGYTSNDLSCKITATIENTVLSQSPGLDQTTSSCP